MEKYHLATLESPCSVAHSKGVRRMGLKGLSLQ